VIGYLAIITASVIWSITPALVSRFSRYIKPFIFTALRAVIATLTLVPIAFLNNFSYVPLQSYALVLIIVSGLLGPGIGDACYTKAIQRVGGSLAVVLSYIYIFIAQFMAVAFLGEFMSISLIIGSVLAFVGIVVAVSSNNFGRVDIQGIIYSLIAALSWSSAAVMVRLVLNYADTFTVTLYRLAVTAVILSPIAIFLEGIPGKRVIKQLIFVATVTGILGFSLGVYLFVYSISTVGVSATAMATALTPVLSQITTKLLAGERPTKENVVGASLISIGITISAML
jgi:DME family drug/metabolite transporter